MSKDTGGPAFPAHCDTMPGEGGMTLRDYFAAKAPSEPQAWFRPEMKGIETGPNIGHVVSSGKFICMDCKEKYFNKKVIG